MPGSPPPTFPSCCPAVFFLAGGGWAPLLGLAFALAGCLACRLFAADSDLPNSESPPVWNGASGVEGGFTESITTIFSIVVSCVNP